MSVKNSSNLNLPNVMRLIHRYSLLILFVFSLGFTVGCGGPAAEDLLAAANDNNIKRVANLYSAFQSRHGWNGPKDEEQFMTFLKNWNPKKLKNIGIDPNGIDDVFISSRDGEPFKIRYGIRGHLLGTDDPVVFEATGVEGKRMVGFLNMTIEEVDAAEYESLWKQPPKNK